MRTLPRSLRKTLTRDRGSENLGYKELEKLGLRCYFANAHHPLGAEDQMKIPTDSFCVTFLKRPTSVPLLMKRLGEWSTCSTAVHANDLALGPQMRVFYQLTGVALQG